MPRGVPNKIMFVLKMDAFRSLSLSTTSVDEGLLHDSEISWDLCLCSKLFYAETVTNTPWFYF